MFFFLTFLIIYAPVLDIGIGALADLIVIISILLIIYYQFKKNKISIDKNVFSLLTILLFLFIYSLFITLFFDMSEFENSSRGIFRTVKAIINILGCYALYKICRKKYQSYTQDILIIHVFYAVSFHALIMLIEFLSADVRNFIYSFTFAKYQLEHYQMFRMAGLASAGGAQISAFQSMGFFIGLYLLYIRTVSKIYLLLGLLLILISTLLSGRTGLFTILVFTPLFCLWLSVLSGKKAVLKTGATMVAFVVLVILVFEFIHGNDFFGLRYLEVIFNRTFDSFINYSSSEGLHDDTLDVLAKMWFVPNEFTTFIFGKIHILGVGVREIQSDIGYVRFLWGYGLIGSLIIYCFYFMLVYFVYSAPTLTKDLKRKSLVYFSIFLIFFFHSKEEFMFVRHGLSIVMLLVLPYVTMRKGNEAIDS